MTLRDVDEKGNLRNVLRLDHQQEFDRVWLSIPLPQRIAIEAEINRRLDESLRRARFMSLCWRSPPSSSLGIIRILGT